MSDKIYTEISLPDAPKLPKVKKILFKARIPLHVTHQENQYDVEENGINQGLIFQLVGEMDIYLDDPKLQDFLKTKSNINNSCIPGYRIVERHLKVLNNSRFKGILTFRTLHDDIDSVLRNFEPVTEEDIETLKILYDFDEYEGFCMVKAYRDTQGWNDGDDA